MSIETYCCKYCSKEPDFLIRIERSGKRSADAIITYDGQGSFLEIEGRIRGDIVYGYLAINYCPKCGRDLCK